MRGSRRERCGFTPQNCSAPRTGRGAASGATPRASSCSSTAPRSGSPSPAPIRTPGALRQLLKDFASSARAAFRDGNDTQNPALWLRLPGLSLLRSLDLCCAATGYMDCSLGRDDFGDYGPAHFAASAEERDRKMPCGRPIRGRVPIRDQGSVVMRRASVKETGVRNGAYGADKFGFDGVESIHWNPARRPSTSSRSPDAKPSSPLAARWSPIPAFTPAARRRTSSSSAMRTPRRPYGGTTTARSRRSSSSASMTTSSRTPRASSCSRRISMAAPIRPYASRPASSPSSPGIRCSSARC